MFHVEYRVRLCRVGAVGDACAQFQFAAAGVLHAHLQCPQGAVVFAHVVELWFPGSSFVAAHGKSVLVGAVDEAFVGPSVAPGVDDDPCAAFVLVAFAQDAVAVQIEQDAVVVAHDGQCMVYPVAPAGDVFFSHNTRQTVCSGGVIGYGALVAGAGHTDAADAACAEVRVAAVVPEPVFHIFAARFGIYPIATEGVAFDAVEHGRVPFVVALHPAEVRSRAVLVAEDTGVGGSAVNNGRGDTVGHGHAFLARVAVGEQPGEVRGIDVFRKAGVGVAEGVDFVGEHVADARGRSAGTSVL